MCFLTVGTSDKLPSTKESSGSFVDVTLERNLEEAAHSSHNPQQRRCSAPPTPAAPPSHHPHGHEHHSTAPTPLQQNPCYQNIPQYTDAQPHQHTPLSERSSVPSNFQRAPPLTNEQRYFSNPSDRKNMQGRNLTPVYEPAGSSETPQTSWHDRSHNAQSRSQYDHLHPCYLKVATGVQSQPGTQPLAPHTSSPSQHRRMQQQPHQGAHQGMKKPRTEMITGHTTRLHNMDLAGVPNQQPSAMAGAYYSPQGTRSEGFTQNQSKQTFAPSQQPYQTSENHQKNGVPGERSRNVDIPDSETTEGFLSRTPDQSPPSSRHVWGPPPSQRSPNMEHQPTSTANTQGTIPPVSHEAEVTSIHGEASYGPRRDQQYEQSHDDPVVSHLASRMSEMGVENPNTPNYTPDYSSSRTPQKQTAISVPPQTIDQQKFYQADKRHESFIEQQQNDPRGASMIEQQRGQLQLQMPQYHDQQPSSRDNESLATTINSSLGTQTSVGSSTLSEYSFTDDTSTSSIGGPKSSITSNPVPPPSPNLPVVGASHMPEAREIQSVYSLTKYQQEGYDETTSATTTQSSLSTYASEFLGNLSPPTDNPSREHFNVDDRYHATPGAAVHPPNGDLLPAIPHFGASPGETPSNIVRNPHFNASMMTESQFSDQSMDHACENLPTLTEANQLGQVIPEDTNEYLTTKQPAVASASSEEGYSSFAVLPTQGGMYKAENEPPVTCHKNVDRLENNSLVLPNKCENVKIHPFTIQRSPQASPPQNNMARARASPIQHDIDKNLEENMPQLIPAANDKESEQCTSVRSNVTEPPEQVPFRQEHYSPNQIGGSAAIVQSTPSLTTNQDPPESLKDQQEIQQTQFPVEPSFTHQQETQGTIYLLSRVH